MRDRRWRPAWTGIAAAALLTACGGSATFCIEGVPCGPVPRYDENRPAAVVTIQRFERLGIGDWHSCMLTATGEAWCWGSNEYGQLGAASTQRCMDDTVDCSALPLRVSGAPPLARLAASHSFTCALTSAGAAWCWGFGAGGQLGDGRRVDSLSPVAVAGGHGFSTLASSLFAGLTCGLDAEGVPWCWGSGFAYGSSGPAATPLPERWTEAASIAWERIAIGEAHACGLDRSGRAWCIGSNGFGTLGNGNQADSAVPVPVAGGRVYRDIAVGPDHSCALTTDGAAWCWGFGAAVGDGGATDQVRRLPVAVSGNLRFDRLTAGTRRSCALTTDGDAWCWGEGGSGGLGNGASQTQNTPVAVVGGLRFASIAAGGMATCAVTLEGTAQCWGSNEVGALGQPIVPH